MNYRNPVFAENGWIVCEIEHPQYGWIPFACDPDDKEPSFDTRALYDAMKGEAAPYVPPEVSTDDEIAGQVRLERNRLLSASDWTQVADAPVDQSAWAAYRQALRDVPSQEGFPASITWPIRPI